MKVAIAHDTLTEFGGAERVLQSLLHLYPDAHVYTAYVNRAFVREMFPDLLNGRLYISAMQAMKLARRGYLFQFLSPVFWRSFNFEQYDVVIASSAFFLANTIRVKSPVFIQYIHCPPKNLFGMSPKVPTQKVIPYERYLGKIYERSLKNGAYIVTNSVHMQRTLSIMFGVKAQVIYPPVAIPISPPVRRGSGKYYLIVSRLDETKGVELAIRACNRLKVSLKIVGTGTNPHYVQYLRSLAGPTVDFLGFLEGRHVQRLYRDSIAFIFPAREEDFGIAPVEAMAHGVPVIAYYGGGVRETVIEGVTGSYFYTYSQEALMRVITSFSPDKFNAQTLRKHAQKFNEEIFHNKIKHLVNTLLKSKLT